jgi:F0F1-type ATP synthase alpha subunit
LHKITETAANLLDYINKNAKAVIDNIKNTGDLTSDDKSVLEKLFEQFFTVEEADTGVIDTGDADAKNQ